MKIWKSTTILNDQIWQPDQRYSSTPECNLNLNQVRNFSRLDNTLSSSFTTCEHRVRSRDQTLFPNYFIAVWLRYYNTGSISMVMPHSRFSLDNYWCRRSSYIINIPYYSPCAATEYVVCHHHHWCKISARDERKDVGNWKSVTKEPPCWHRLLTSYEGSYATSLCQSVSRVGASRFDITRDSRGIFFFSAAGLSKKCNSKTFVMRFFRIVNVIQIFKNRDVARIHNV